MSVNVTVYLGDSLLIKYESDRDPKDLVDEWVEAMHKAKQMVVMQDDGTRCIVNAAHVRAINISS